MNPKLWLAILCGATIALAGCSRSGDSPMLSQPPAHGTDFLLQFDAPVNQDDDAWFRIRTALAKRCAKLDVKIYLHRDAASSNQVHLLTPVTNAQYIENLKNTLGRGGRLELRLVHENSAELIKQGLSEVGYESLTETDAFISAPAKPATYLVKKKPELTGAYIESAFTSKDPLGKPEINFELNDKGARIFEKVTADNVGRQLAIVVDGELLSAPRINAAIPAGRALITGNFTAAAASELADALESPLPSPVTVTVQKTF